MLRLKLAIESLQTHIDYGKKANGMQTGLITIGIAEAETLLELLKEQQKLIDGITHRRMNNGEFD